MIDSLKASGAAVITWVQDTGKWHLLQHITWVQDNAKWHLLHATRGRLAGVKIVNTAPHFLQTNLLDCIFSSVRRLFRKRPLCATELEELRQIVSCFEKSNTDSMVSAARYRMAHHIGLLLSRITVSGTKS